MSSANQQRRDLRPTSLDNGGTLITVLPLILAGLLSVLTGILHLISRAFAYFVTPPKDLNGKTILITGTGRGLGRRLALEVSRRGAKVACADINPATNEETVRLIEAEGGTAKGFIVNIADSKQVEALRSQVEAAFGPVHVLVNNAALIYALEFTKTTNEDIEAMFKVNCIGTIFMTKEFLSGMLMRNSGQIVTISSVAARMGIPMLSLYSSTKHANSGFIEAARRELHVINPDNKVVLTAVHPFIINTSEDYMDLVDSRVPLLTEEYAVRDILDAILYDKEDVTIPNGIKFLFALASNIPDIFTRKFFYHSGMQFNVMPREKWEKLPFGSIKKAVAGK